MATLGIWPSSGLPCHKSVPEDGCESPVNMRSRVDLPQPDGPSKAMIFPDSMTRFVKPDDLNSGSIRLRIGLLNADRFDDRWFAHVNTPVSSIHDLRTSAKRAL